MKPIVSDTPYKHIFIMEDGRAMIGATRIKVEYIATDSVHWRMSPEEIKENRPDLTMGQVYSALAYYWDHKDIVDRQIEEGLEFVERMMELNEPHLLEERWRFVKCWEKRTKAKAIEQLSVLTT